MATPLPSPLSSIRVVPRSAEVRGVGLFETLSPLNDESLMRWMISKPTFDVAIGTPVEEVLRQTVKDLRSMAGKMGPAWRWKAFKTLPVNLENQTEFLKECTVKKPAMRRLVELILTSVFPHQLLGKANVDILREWLVDVVYSYKTPAEYPKLRILDSAPLRAMRSAVFKKAAAAAYLNIEILQKASVVYIAHFVSDITLSVLLQYVQVLLPRFQSQSQSGTRTFYSKRGFNYWRKKEMRLFKADYKLSKVEDKRPVDKNLISHTRCVVTGTSMRPICPFQKSLNWSYANKMQLVNAVLDYHLQCVRGHRPLGVHSEIRQLKQYFTKFRNEHPKKRLFFIKSDVSKCFANLDWDILESLLRDLIQARPAVVAFVVTKGHTGRFFRLICAGANRDEARNGLEKKISRKNLSGIHTGHISYEEFPPATVQLIMDSIAELRFTLGSNRNQLYSMAKGVPQGCILSSRLAHIYLAAYDTNTLLPIVGNHGKMFRYADDYFFALDNKETAVEILDELQRPMNSFGLRFKKEKTIVSFNTPGYTRKGRVIVWCGASIDTKKNMVVSRPRRKATTLLLRQHTIQRLSALERVKYRRMWREYERKAASD